MAFDLNTAKPTDSGFELSSAKPVDALAPNKFKATQEQESTSGFDPNRFAPKPPATAPEQPKELPAALKRRVQDAYAEGDVQLAEFLKKSQWSDPEEQGDVGPVDRLVSGAKKLGERVAFETQRRIGNLKERVTKSEQQTELTKSLPEVGFADKKHPDYSEFITEQKMAELGIMPPRKAWAAIEAIDTTAQSDEERKQMYEKLPYVAVSEVDGNTFLTFDNNYISQLNKPGLSWKDAETTAKQALVFALGSASAPARFGPQVLAAAGVQSGLELGSYAMGGEINAEEVPFVALTEGLSFGLMKTIAKGWAKVPPARKSKIKSWRDLEPYMDSKEFSRIKKAKEAQEGLNAPYLMREQVQHTPGRDFKELERIQKAALDVENAEKIANQTFKQDVFSDQNIRQQIENIAPGVNGVEDGSRMVRDASSKVFEDLESKRAIAASRAFGKAFKDDNFVPLESIRDVIKSANQAGVFPKSNERTAINEILGMIESGSMQIKAVRGRLAQKLKWELDSLHRRFDKDQSNAVPAMSLIKKTRDSLIDAIDDANPGYKLANEKFSSATKEIDELEETILGVTRGTSESKVARLTKLFDEDDISSVMKMKGLIDKQNPAAFYALYKGWLGNKLSKIRGIEDSPNKSKMIYDALFASEDMSRRVSDFAPNKEIRQNLNWLKDYLSYSKNIRISSRGASQDLPEGIIEAGRQGEVQGVLASVLGATEKVLREYKSNTLTEAIMNPRWAESMKNIRGLNRREVPAALDALLRSIKESTKSQATELEMTGQSSNETDSE